MAFSNSQLAQKLSNLIDYWSDFAEEYANWLGGTINGGLNSDGRYELTDYIGNTRLVKSPARLEEDVSGQVDSAEAHKDAAAASETAAAGSASTATTQAGLADTARIASEDAQSGAEVARDGAQNAETNAIAARSAAQAARDKAQLWAEEDFEVEVETDAYSAKHWATVAQGFAGDVDSGLYYQATEVDSLLADKSDTTHTHDGRYYTEGEVDSLLSGKSDTGHTHDHGSLTGLGDNDHPQYGLLDAGNSWEASQTFLSTNHWINESAGLDEKDWLLQVLSSGELRVQARTDANAPGDLFIRMFRTGTSADEIELNADLMDFNGDVDISGNLTLNGNYLRLAGADGDTAQISCDGLDAYFRDGGGNGVRLWRFKDHSLGVAVEGGEFRIWDDSVSDRGVFHHDGTDFNTDFFGTTAWNINGASEFIFNGAFQAVSSSAPHLYLEETDAPSNEKIWLIGESLGGTLRLGATTSDGAPGSTSQAAITAFRSGTNIDEIVFRADLLTFNGAIEKHNKGRIPYFDDSTYTGGDIHVGSSAPGSPSKGTIWFDTS